jgi:hypothetical protein
MMTRAQIKAFVKGSLGCTCPDEVFNVVDDVGDIEIAQGLSLFHQITVGNRLLIYVYQADRIETLKEDVPILVRHGNEEKTLRGYNRFRLVILSDAIPAVRQIADPMFESANDQENTHLHVIDRGEFFR